MQKSLLPIPQISTPLVSDQLLMQLASPDNQAILGEWDAETRALLATALPEMATELRNRRAADFHALQLIKHPEAVEQSLTAARAILRQPDPVSERDLTIACQTLVQNSKFAEERAAASDVLAQMQAAA